MTGFWALLFLVEMAHEANQVCSGATTADFDFQMDYLPKAWLEVFTWDPVPSIRFLRVFSSFSLV